MTKHPHGGNLKKMQERRIRKLEIETWKEMKELMRKTFLPPSYERDAYDRLQNLTQDSKSLEEYHKEMIMTIRRANVQEPKTSMTTFLCGLNRDIQCIVKLQHYESLDMVHQAKKIERQLERKHSYKKTYQYNSFSGKDKSKKEGSSPSKQQGSKSPSGKHVSNPSISSTSRNISIKCFKCLHNIVQTRKPKF